MEKQDVGRKKDALTEEEYKTAGGEKWWPKNGFREVQRNNWQTADLKRN